MEDNLFRALVGNKGTFLSEAKYVPPYVEEEKPPSKYAMFQKTHPSDYGVENYSSGARMENLKFIVLIIMFVIVGFLLSMMLNRGSVIAIYNVTAGLNKKQIEIEE